MFRDKFIWVFEYKKMYILIEEFSQRYCRFPTHFSCSYPLHINTDVTDLTRIDVSLLWDLSGVFLGEERKEGKRNEE